MASEFKTENQKFSYALGQSVGNNFKKGGIHLAYEEAAFANGIADAFKGISVISKGEIDQIIQSKLAELQSSVLGEVKVAGEAFLIENSKKHGITTTASGLQFEIVSSGDASGQKPMLDSQVTTHYTGQLIDGQVFDSSVQRGQPATFPVSGVIAGWTEALQLMVPGDQWRLYIPFHLAYGERGAGNDIPPFSALIFDIELITVD